MNTRSIAYFKNGLGNFIEYTPALQALASMDDSGKVDICLDSEWNDSRRQAIEDVCSKCDFIEEMINYPRQSFKKDYSRWLYTIHNCDSEAYKIFQRKAPQLLNIHINWEPGCQHEVKLYMQAVRQLGYTGSTPKQFVPVDTSGPDLSKLPHQPLIGICNGGFGNIRDSKKWPHFQELSETLYRYFGSTIVKVGFGEELSEVSNEEHAINYVNKLSITQTAHVLKQLDFLVINDTGLMHVADALEIPMVVIFGGSLVSKNGPLNGSAHVVKLGTECQPCQGKTMLFKTCENHHCLNNLTQAMVMNEIRSFYSMKRRGA